MESNSDPSNGYEAHAEAFIRARSPEIGAGTVREWSRSLGKGASVLDLGCGHGIPVSKVLTESGFAVYAVDASATLIAEYRRNFPLAHAEHSAVEHSRFFQRKFDGIVACGLMFLLPPESQAKLIAKAASALNPGGLFLFTAPGDPVTWIDVLTRRSSISLGRAKYIELLSTHGLTIVGQYLDEGGNQYYSARNAHPPEHKIENDSAASL